MSTEFAFIALAAVSMGFAVVAFYLGKVWLIGYTVATLLLANMVGPKVVSVYGLAITAGTPLFAGLPIATDLLSEYYGKAIARQAVYIAFGGMMLFSVASFFVLAMEALPFATVPGGAVDTIFTTSLRLMIASPVAYLLWQLVDIQVYSAIHNWTGEGFLWLRNNISTIVAQAGSTVTFFFLGFYGTGQPWIEIAVVTIFFYWIIAICDTSVIYATKAIKKRSKNT